MTYNLYFESGNRAYILNLSDDKEESKNINIIRENTEARDELLRVRKSNTLISYIGKKKDVDVFIENIVVNGKNVDIHLTQNNSDFGKSKEENQCVTWRNFNEEEILFEDCANNGINLNEYIFSFIYSDFVGTVKVVCAPLNQIYDVVIDFGSEASQMLIHQCASGVTSEPIRLFKCCAEHFYNLKGMQPNEYDQQDENERLFRSIFFGREHAQNGKEAIAAIPSPKDPLISFISKRDDINKGERIPNVKISYLSDVCPSGLNMKEIHRGIVLRFIHEAIRYIYGLEKNNLPKRSYAMRITLLIPNVMCQNEVSSFIDDVGNYVKCSEFIKYVPKDFKISMIEIKTCSESDASLLNWINKQETVKPGRYLIIDMGKGTTDFSLVNVYNASQVESLLRGGFIGAGNVISYVLLENYLLHMGGLSEYRNLIKTTLSAEIPMLYSLEQVIEKIKRENSDNPTISQEFSGNIQGIKVEAIIDRIASEASKNVMPDDFQIISGMIQRLVTKEIFGRIGGLKFDHVVLSGRAFKFEKLKEETIRYIKEIFPNVQVHYEEAESKKGCLYGPLTHISISKYTNMIGIPKVVDTSKTHEDRTNDINEKLEELKKRDVRNDRVTSKRIKELISLWTRTQNFMGQIFSDLDEESDGYSIADSTTHFINNTKSSISHSEIPSILELMTSGIPVSTNYGPNTRFYISGISYIPANNYEIQKDVNYSIYFDGHKFYLRSDNSCWELRKDDAHINDTSLLFESLFPYSIQILGNEAQIPLSKPKKI